MRMPRSHFAWRVLFWLMRYWPPFVGARIRVHLTSPDLTRLEVRMPMRPWNRNFVGVHFGGSLYAMTDPFYMLLMMARMGERYVIWDKSAAIRFKKPGRGLVRAVFELPESRIEEIKRACAADPKGRHDAQFIVRVETLSGELIAEVDKVVYVKAKGAAS